MSAAARDKRRRNTGRRVRASYSYARERSPDGSPRAKGTYKIERVHDEGIRELVRQGLYPSQSAAVDVALARFLKAHGLLK